MNNLHLSHRRWYFAPPLILLALAALGLIFMLVWNAVIPDVFHLIPLSYLQAVGIIVISRILFGGFPRPWHHSRWNNFHDKLSKMTPEERELFFKNFRHHYHSCNKSENPGSEERSGI